MKIFLDTEFYERPYTIDFISLGMASDSGDTFYAEGIEYDPDNVSGWVKENVLTQLHLEELKSPFIRKEGENYHAQIKANNTTIGSVILEWLDLIGSRYQPEFWSYYSGYDWVIFCWLFGSMSNLPNGFPMFCRDIRQIMDDVKDWSDKPIPGDGHHNALDDAHYHKRLYEWAIKETQ